MIAIASENGSLLKRVPLTPGGDLFGFHPLFGFVSEKASQDRMKARKLHGRFCKNSDWLCRFFLGSDAKSGHLALKAVDGCTAKALSEKEWQLSTQFGKFLISESAALDTARLAETEESKDTTWKVGLALALLVLLVFLFAPTPKETAVQPEVLEPVAVKVVPETQRAVPVPSALDLPAELIKKDALKDAAGKRAVAQNLGFLSLLGKKDLSKALGGMPTSLKDASPGAGPGGKEGSGGELLVGLGRGVTRTTVGNTGVAGLGGIGTKGVGGGGGGYGNALVGSGAEGKVAAISSLPLSQDVVLEGGLDRSVIEATIAKYLSQVQACYEEGLRRNPGLTGLVSMSFEIGGSGSLNYAKVAKSTLGDGEVEQCIASRMMGWKFPKPLGGVSVKVNRPFMLRPVHS